MRGKNLSAILIGIGIVFSPFGLVHIEPERVRADGDIPINSTYFPDENFREFVKKYDVDSCDGYLSQYERTIPKKEAMDCSSLSIRSLSGIEYFDLYSLECNDNQLIELDLSQNTNLRYLECNNNQLSSLDLGQNTNLESLWCDSNHISRLNLANNVNLQILRCCKNELTSLDVSMNIKLTDLSCSSNQLTYLDLNQNANLQYLFCEWNELESLDLSNNLQLIRVDCSYNKLTNLEMSQGEFLEELDCSYNKLTTLDVSHNNNLRVLWCTANMLQNLDVNNNSGLESLVVAGNQIVSIDVNKNTMLCVLDCSGNNLSTLDVSMNTVLTNLDCSSNVLKSLDVTNNHELNNLICSKNVLTNLILDNEKLVKLDCQENELSELNVSKMKALKHLTCSRNQLTKLNVTSNTSLTGIDCNFNQLSTLDVSKNLELKYLNCFFNCISELDVSKNTNLLSLNCNANKIGELNLEKNTNLQYLYCGDNLLKILEVGQCNQLIQLVCSENYLAQKPSVPNGCELTYDPQNTPSPTPSKSVTKSPTRIVTKTPTKTVTKAPTKVVTKTPTKKVTKTPTKSVTKSPTKEVTKAPTKAVTKTPTKRVTKVPTKSVTKAPTKKTTKTPTKAPTTVPANGTIGDFVERLYTVALNRASEKAGKDYWIDEITSGRRTGGDCAHYFLIDAPEFLNRKLSVEDFVETLYRTFFGRNSESAGKAYWVSEIKDGRKTRADVINGFIDSTEWCNICARYGVRSGAPSAKAEIPSPNAKGFATRLYTCCLGRDPEEGGLKYWSLALTNLEKTGAEAAKQFFESEEFQNMRTSNTEYVTRLYRTFMGREPETDGLNYWVGELVKGRSRLYVMAGFASSQEFTNICKKYGIERGEIHVNSEQKTLPLSGDDFQRILEKQGFTVTIEDTYRGCGSGCVDHREALLREGDDFSLYSQGFYYRYSSAEAAKKVFDNIEDDETLNFFERRDNVIYLEGERRFFRITILDGNTIVSATVSSYDVEERSKKVHSILESLGYQVPEIPINQPSEDGQKFQRIMRNNGFTVNQPGFRSYPIERYYASREGDSTYCDYFRYENTKAAKSAFDNWYMRVYDTTLDEEVVELIREGVLMQDRNMYFYECEHYYSIVILDEDKILHVQCFSDNKSKRKETAISLMVALGYNSVTSAKPTRINGRYNTSTTLGSGNIANWGLATCNSQYDFYVGYTNGKGMSLYQENKANGEVKKLYSAKSIDSLALGGDYLFFCAGNSAGGNTQYELVRMNLKNGSTTTLASDASSYLQVYKSKLYYVSLSGKLVCSDFDGNSKYLYSDDESSSIESFCILNDRIYFVTRRGSSGHNRYNAYIQSMNLSGDDIVMIRDDVASGCGNFDSLFTDGKWIYVAIDDDHVDDFEYYRFAPNGTNWQHLFSSGLYDGRYEDCCHCNVANGVIYRGCKDGLYKSLDAQSWEQIAAGDYSDICIVGEWIYSREHGNAYRDEKCTISRTRIDGSCVEKVG